MNNYNDADLHSLENCDCRYMVFGYEIGKEGTEHLQGYTYFKDAKTLSALKKWGGPWAKMHLEISKGNAFQNITYCKKDGNFEEYGKEPVQGKRTDIDVMKDMVCAGADMKKIVMEAKSFQAVRFAEILKNYISEDRTEAPWVLWRWGKAGVGKSSWVHGWKDKKCYLPWGDDIYIKDGTQWWNGYNGQSCICIDDFDGKWPFRDFLKLLDRYPYQGQYKGGYVKISSPYIVITCEFPPEYFWSDNELKQVSRRLKEVLEVCCTDSYTKVGGNTDPDLDLNYEFRNFL